MTSLTLVLCGGAALILAITPALMGCPVPDKDSTKPTVPGETPSGDITWSVSANGAANTENTTRLTFTFGKPVSDLTPGEITITNPGGAGAAFKFKNTLDGGGSVWTQEVIVGTPGDVKVKIARSGIDSAEKTVTVHLQSGGGGGQSSGGGQGGGTGGEQGLEPGALDLPEDITAANEALAAGSWWQNSQATLNQRMAWYNDAKFGLFIHWGPYSQFGGVWNGSNINTYAEHLQRAKKIPVATYKDQVVKTFNPDKFNAADWVAMAKQAGMQYMVITAKHHDGFAMYFSNQYRPAAAYPSYDAKRYYDMRLTQRPTLDPMRLLRDEAKRQGIKFGFYYSHAFDWEHPYAPGNDWDNFNAITGWNTVSGSSDSKRNPGGDSRGSYGGDAWWKDSLYSKFLPNAQKYLDDKANKQIAELVDKYDPDIMWFDTPHKIPLYMNIDVLKKLRALGAAIVINGRLAEFTASGQHYQLGDYSNSGDRAAYLFPLVDQYWESIPTTNESYGYSSYDTSHKPPEHFIKLLATAASKGGNILMNVGPKGDGTWDSRDIPIFQKIGEWMAVNGESIYGTTRTNDIPIPNWGVITKKDNKLYLHVHQWPSNGTLYVGSLTAAVSGAKILKTGATLAAEQDGADLKITGLPAVCPDKINTADAAVIELTLSGAYTADKYRLLDSGVTNSLLAFDAVNAETFGRGDGKTNANNLSGWTSTSQYIEWNVRTRETKTFEASLSYLSGGSGTMNFAVDGVDAGSPVAFSGGATSTAVPISLAAGNHIIRLKLVSGSDLRPRVLYLAPTLGTNIAPQATVTSSADYSTTYNGAKAADGSLTTRWATPDGQTTQWLEFVFSGNKTVSAAKIFAYENNDNRVTSFTIEYDVGGQWQIAYTGGNIRGAATADSGNLFEFSQPVTSNKFRFFVNNALPGNKTASFWEVQLFE